MTFYESCLCTRIKCVPLDSNTSFAGKPKRVKVEHSERRDHWKKISGNVYGIACKPKSSWGKKAAAFRSSKQKESDKSSSCQLEIPSTAVSRDCPGEGDIKREREIGNSSEIHLNLSHCLNLLLSLSNLCMKMVKFQWFCFSPKRWKPLKMSFPFCSVSGTCYSSWRWKNALLNYCDWYYSRVILHKLKRFNFSSSSSSFQASDGELYGNHINWRRIVNFRETGKVSLPDFLMWKF